MPRCNDSSTAAGERPVSTCNTPIEAESSTQRATFNESINVARQYNKWSKPSDGSMQSSMPLECGTREIPR